MLEYRQLQERIAQLEQEKMRLSVYSTSPGQVTEINVAQGQVLPKGEELIAVAHQDKQIRASSLSPNHRAGVQLGERVDVVFPSGKVIKGREQYNPRITGRLPAYLDSDAGTPTNGHCALHPAGANSTGRKY